MTRHYIGIVGMVVCMMLSLSGIAAAQEKTTAFSSTQSKQAVISLAHWMKASGDDSACEDQGFAKVPLSREDAALAAGLLWNNHVDRSKTGFATEWTDKLVQASGHTMKFDTKVFGQKPKDGWSLYISLHGGGGTTQAVNDQQWHNQITLYEPNEGIYVAPRAPTDAWNMWHQDHMDPLLDRLIQGAVIHMGVNVNRVYLMGYSAGGDGVYQLAPRMADRWAAAAMMAGHPNDAVPLGLRNIGFTIHAGELDGAYKRNEVAAEWGIKLDALRQQDLNGYAHVVQIHKGLGHWMNREDAVAVPWMARFTRTPWPDKVVWYQDDVTHRQFYWLAVSEKNCKQGNLIEVERKGQDMTITKVTGLDELTMCLNDSMVDLDQPVAIHYQGKCLFQGLLPRRIASLQQSLKLRGDQALMFSAEITVTLDPVGIQSEYRSVNQLVTSQPFGAADFSPVPQADREPGCAG